MWSKKSIRAKLANSEGKLTVLCKQIDQMCSKLARQNTQPKNKNSPSTPSKGRGRPPKEGVEKLIELEQKLDSQSLKIESEIAKIILNVNKDVKDLSAEIEQKRMILNRI
jgi:hypothetical protein